MAYNVNTFLKPLSPSDKLLQIVDLNGVVKYTINPFTIKNTFVRGNVIHISLNSDREILIDFRNQTESRQAIVILESQLETLRNRTPNYIDRIIEEYIQGMGLSYSNGNLYFSANLVPSINSTFSIGMSGSVWNDLYVASSSIYLGNVKLSTDGTNLLVNDNQIVSNGGGSQGPTGPQGFQGSTGPQGNQGFQGPTGPTGVDGNGVAYYGQISKIISGTISVATQSVYQSTGLTASLDSENFGISLGVNDTFAIKNTSGINNLFEIYASADIEAGNNKILGIKLALNGVLINESECRAPTGTGTSFAKLITSWILELSPDDEVALYVTNFTNSGNITLQRGRIIARTVGREGAQGTTGPQGNQGFQGSTGPQGNQGTQGTTGPQGSKGDTGSLPDNFEGFLTGATAISLLMDENNWNPGGSYSGATAIDGTNQGQMYYGDGEFFFLAVNNNEWIRWKIGGTAS